MKQNLYEDNVLGFDTINIVKNYHLKNDSTQPSCNLKIRFIYPSSYSDTEILLSVQNVFLADFFDEHYKGLSPQEAIQKYAENYVNNYKADAEVFFKERENDFSEDSHVDNYFSYYENISNEIVFNKSALLSYRINQINHKGGSNSFHQYSNRVINLNTGRLLNETDIFEDGYEKALNAFFKKKILEANNVEDINTLEDMGFFGIEEIMPNNNFFVNDKGITYTFNKGEYSALQLDEINIFLSYEEITHLLKEKSPVSTFIDL